MTHLSKGSEKPAAPKDGFRVYSMRFCPFAERVRLVLAAKGIDVEVCNIDLKNKPEWFLELNPDGKVPVLEFADGRVLYESVICCEYLEEAFPQLPLYPKDHIEKNKQRLLIDHFSKKFIPLIYKRLLTEDPSASEELQVSKVMNQLEKELISRNTEFFGGEKPRMLDYAIWPWFERFPLHEGFYSSFKATSPVLAKWCESMKSDPAAQACSFPMEWHTKFAQDYRKGIAEAQLIGLEK